VKGRRAAAILAVPMSSPGEDPPDETAALFADYVDRVENGETVDFDGYCADHPAHAAGMREAHALWRELHAGLGPRPGLSESSAAPGTASETWTEVLDRLARHSPTQTRYEIRGRVGEGGMGVVLEVWDADLRRRLAMKVMNEPAGRKAGAARNRDRVLGRFLEEAQITGQLDHPGIVPVHELGVDASNRPYFTMKLVRGDDLRSVLQKVRTGADGWNRTRALGVLLRVCEAMAFAHSRNVIHRDLKPANIMVGRFGETYVMDWGLARVLGDGDSPAAPEAAAMSRLWSDRRSLAAGAPDSPLVTKEGDIMGTPAYMSPEQASGQVARVGTASDVYAIGAILYELLAGTAPYVERGVGVSPEEIRSRVVAGPPRPIEDIDRKLPPELTAICARAMARDPARRYGDMEQLADDLRNYLEGRVVRAHATGALAEFRKWVARNRATAAALGGLLVVVLGALAILWRSESVQAREVRARLDARVVRELIERATDLGPIHPDALRARREWLDEANDLLSRAAQYRARLAALRARALPYGPTERERDREAHPARRDLERATTLVETWQQQLEKDPAAASQSELAELDWHRRRLARLQAMVDERRTWLFADPEDAQLHRSLGELVDNLGALDQPTGGLVQQVTAEIARAGELRRCTVDEHAPAWELARAAIRANPHYRGLDLPPQLGLVPLREDPLSHLWEFWHVLSGEQPQVGAGGEYALAPDTGIVLVLLPGDPEFRIGSSPLPGDPRHDPNSHPSEQPLREVPLQPFFLGKHELTQGQWILATGHNPSRYYAGSSHRGQKRVTRAHPVERINYHDAAPLLRRLGLELPTEAQLEYAVRGGTDAPFWWSGRAGFDLAQVIVFRAGVERLHQPVGSGPANPFGLHHVSGNVWELCRDWYADTYGAIEFAPGDGEIRASSQRDKVMRGGSFANEILYCRSASRVFVDPAQRAEYLGLRPARPLDP
jgi:formylglycine-generating enzyme required for sulfatase activity